MSNWKRFYANRLRPLSPGLILVVLLGLLSACDGNEQKQPKRPPTTRVVNVDIATVSHAPIAAQRIITGALEAEQEVRIFNQEQGRILQLPYFPGDALKKGDLLVAIDDSIIGSELDKAQASLKQAKLDSKRLGSLVPRKLASEDELARARTAVELADAEVALLTTRLNHTKIHAPFSGVVSERNFEPGDVASLHSHILSLFDPEKLKIKLTVSELLLNELQPGEAVAIRIDALGEQQWPGKIKRIYPAVDAATHQGTVEVALIPVPQGARPGQLCRVTLSTRTTPRRTVHLAAVRHDNLGEFVYRVDTDNKVHLARIRTGLLLGEHIEVLEGLKQGDRVVIKGFLGLRDGITVKPTPTANKTVP